MVLFDNFSTTELQTADCLIIQMVLMYLMFKSHQILHFTSLHH